jgi:hypothetical protein
MMKLELQHNIFKFYKQACQGQKLSRLILMTCCRAITIVETAYLLLFRGLNVSEIFLHIY